VLCVRCEGTGEPETADCRQGASRRRSLELIAQGCETEWRDRLIWGDKKNVMPSLLPEFAGKMNLIYIDPLFDTGAKVSSGGGFKWRVSFREGHKRPYNENIFGRPFDRLRVVSVVEPQSRGRLVLGRPAWPFRRIGLNKS
jgi:hypothetical protein